MANTRLSSANGLRSFGDTDFYLELDAEPPQYRVLDGAYGEYNTVLEIPVDPSCPNETHAQEIFDAFYAGYKYGETVGLNDGREALRGEMRDLLGI
jgi:hypothetical protein